MKTLTIEEVAEIFRVSPKTVEGWVKEGCFPAPIQVTARSRRLWLMKDIESFVQQKKGEAA